jgi:hypothetical protein
VSKSIQNKETKNRLPLIKMRKGMLKNLHWSLFQELKTHFKAVGEPSYFYILQNPIAGDQAGPIKRARAADGYILRGVHVVFSFSAAGD